MRTRGTSPSRNAVRRHPARTRPGHRAGATSWSPRWPWRSTRLPHAAILSEESSPDPSALAAETCVVIDPIDGTDEMVAGRPGFAISVAVFQRGEPVAALLDLPARNRRFHGVAGGGAALNSKRVALSPAEHLSQARLAVSATQHRNESL